MKHGIWTWVSHGRDAFLNHWTMRTSLFLEGVTTLFKSVTAALYGLKLPGEQGCPHAHCPDIVEGFYQPMTSLLYHWELLNLYCFGSCIWFRFSENQSLKQRQEWDFNSQTLYHLTCNLTQWATIQSIILQGNVVSIKSSRMPGMCWNQIGRPLLEKERYRGVKTLKKHKKGLSFFCVFWVFFFPTIYDILFSHDILHLFCQKNT